MSEPADRVGGFSRFRIDFSYDGTDFSGWAKQPGLRTVQGELVRALELIFGVSEHDFGMRVAGRTDAGVHATGQVCHIDLNPDQMRRMGRSALTAERVNGLLPPDIRVAAVTSALPGFDARFSATFRRYHYFLADDLVQPNALQTRFRLDVPGELDVVAMDAIAPTLVGLRDFGAFCKPRAEATTIRELRMLRVERLPDGVIRVTIEADAFCHNMVRSIVGALIRVGQHRMSEAELAEITSAAERTSRFKVVEPKGLVLVEVGYPAPEELSAQAERARNIRSLENGNSV